MIEVELLIEVQSEEAKRLEDLGIETEQEQAFLTCWVNPNFIMRIVPQKEDIYLLSFTDEDVIAKINKDELSKIQER